MPVIAVVNRKGGSGKSTLATHLAAHWANQGLPVMLGDVDRQQSTQTWLRLRARQDLPRSAPILGWAVDPRNVLRSPPGIRHVILDTPGGMRGFDLARVVGYADVVLMPVCNSVFDRDSAADGLAELNALPRVASGRCKVAAIGMRLDARTRAGDTLRDWAAGLGVTYLGMLRESQTYVKTVEQGLTLFALPPSKAAADLAQWDAILQWLEPALAAPLEDKAGRTFAPTGRRADAPRAPNPVSPGDAGLPASMLREAGAPSHTAGLSGSRSSSVTAPSVTATSARGHDGGPVADPSPAFAAPAMTVRRTESPVSRARSTGTGTVGGGSSGDAQPAASSGNASRPAESTLSRPAPLELPLPLGKVTPQAGLRYQLRRWLEMLAGARTPKRKAKGSIG